MKKPLGLHVKVFSALRDETMYLPRITITQLTRVIILTSGSLMHREGLKGSEIVTTVRIKTLLLLNRDKRKQKYLLTFSLFSYCCLFLTYSTMVDISVHQISGSCHMQVNSSSGCSKQQ